MNPRHFPAVTLVAALLLLLLAPVASASSQQPCWKAELSVGNPTLVLGEPVYFKITLTNLSDHEVVMPRQPRLWGPYCNLEVEPLDPAHRAEFFQHLGRGQGSPVSVVMTKHPYPAHAEVVIGWLHVFTPMRVGSYRAQYACEVPEIGPDVNPKTKQLESNDEVWRGSVSSNEVVVQAMAPEGIDAQAYEALDHAPMIPSRYGGLLRRFPTSRYSAYVVWSIAAKGMGGKDTDGCVRYAAHGVTYGNSVPCDKEDGCREDGSMHLNAEEMVRWGTRWSRLILKAHPDIWFADEVQLKLALDEYLLGDHASCQARLEDLAEHGRADVAAKAADILAAMRAKGMLEGAEPAPAAAPVPVPAPDPAPVPAPDPAPDSAPAPAPGAGR